RGRGRRRARLLRWLLRRLLLRRHVESARRVVADPLRLPLARREEASREARGRAPRRGATVLVERHRLPPDELGRSPRRAAVLEVERVADVDAAGVPQVGLLAVERRATRRDDDTAAALHLRARLRRDDPREARLRDVDPGRRVEVLDAEPLDDERRRLAAVV